uniref:Uncharacterized protein n=1 Tax=Setaria digitata TaxID=48799 RepID=A0A915PY23_9BILA
MTCQISDKMFKSISTGDLEEGEICDDEETDIIHLNSPKYSSISANEWANSIANYSQLSNHTTSSESLHSADNMQISSHSAPYVKQNDDVQQAKKGNEENFFHDETKRRQSKGFYDSEMSEKNDEEYILEYKIMDEVNESDNEMEISTFQDEAKYQFGLVAQSDGNNDNDNDDDDDDEFSDEIICNEGIVATDDFHSRERNAAGNQNGTKINLVEEVLVDDSWIFQSLGEPSRIVVKGNETTESCVLQESEGHVEQLAEMDLSKLEVIIDVTVAGGDDDKNEATAVVTDKKHIACKESSEIKRIIELEQKLVEEKENYVRNMYSLLVTARGQIANLKKENKRLETKLGGNCTMKCPNCKHQICSMNNLIKPKYIKVLKGRCAIEMSFNNLSVMEEWLAANHLDLNPDGLPVVLEIPQKPTLISTNSLLAPKRNLVPGVQQNKSKMTSEDSSPISSSHFRSPRNIFPVTNTQNMQSTGAGRNFDKRSGRQYESSDSIKQDQMKQEEFSSNIAYNFHAEQQRRPHAKKRLERNNCEEQQSKSVHQTSPSLDTLCDEDQQRHRTSSRSRYSYISRRHTMSHAARRSTSASNHNIAGYEHPPLSDYRSSYAEHHRRSPLHHRPAERSSDRNCHNRSKSIRMRNVEQTL